MGSTPPYTPAATATASATGPIALRFQRLELEQKAQLSPAALACVASCRGPQDLLAALQALGQARDVVAALAMMLPHRQVVWWSCLAVRLLPGLTATPADAAAVTAAESWVQSAAAADAERAGEAADRCDPRQPAGWTAMAAYWSGSSLTPRGQAAVVPAPYLAGTAARTALLLAVHDAGIAGRLELSDLLGIGLALMNGDAGRQAQAALHRRLHDPQHSAA
jgi:hypothetical protein